MASKKVAESALPYELVYNLIGPEQRVLRKVSECFSIEEMRSPSTEILLRDMRTLMHEQYGIGIAAPQVGVGKALFLALVPHHIGEQVTPMPETIFFNPTMAIAKKDEGGMIEMWESCLTLPDKIAKMKRHKHVNVNFLDEEGKRKSIEASGFIAGVLQHEYDHLNGFLYVDRLKSDEEILDIDYFMEKHAETMVTPPGSFKINDGFVEMDQYDIIGRNRMLLLPKE